MKKNSSAREIKLVIESVYRYLSVRNRSLIISYGLAVSSIFFGLFVHEQFAQFVWTASPFLVFLPAVIITSWYGGFLPGFVATIVATIVGDYFFFHPLYTFTITDRTDTVRLLLFSTTGLLISMINQSFYNQKEEKELILERLEISENRFKRIANSVPVMLWILDKNMKTVFANTTLQNLLGLRAQRDSWQNHVHPKDKAYVQKKLKKAFLEKKKFHIECRLKRENGSYHWFFITGIPTMTNTNAIINYIGTCVDINGQKILEQQKTTFLSTVAHELRTPLATAQLINDLMLQKFVNKESSQEKIDLQNMQEELASLSNLMQDLLYFIRGEQESLPLQIKSFNLTALLQTISTHYQQTHPQLKISCMVGKKYVVSADAKRIKQVVTNLLENAIHASNNGGGIFISIKERNNTLHISVQDEGKGIDEDDQKRIFNRYYQGSSDTHKGFGLGLYIAKEILQKHHGKMWVESEKGKGSLFSFSLPYKDI